MGNLDYLSNNLIELQGPVDQATDAAVDNAPDTCEARLYDADMDARLSRYETHLTADAESAATEIYVSDNSPIFIGSTILTSMDNGQRRSSQVQSVGAGGLIDITGYPLLAAASSGSKVTLTVYDSTSTKIGIDDFGQWVVGMNMEITLDDGTTVERTVSLVDPDSGYLTISALGVDAAAGNLVKRRLGKTTADDIDMTTPYGTFPTSDPVAGDPSWGFRGVIPHDHPGLALGLRVRGEITYVDGAMNLRRKVVASVINE